MSRSISASISTKKSISVFFSYSQRDAVYRDELEKHLTFLKRNGKIDIWHDRKILPGEDWDGKIHESLNTADIILLFISPDFCDSQYCWDIETKKALERRERGEALVVPILIRPVFGWEETPIGRLQALPKNGTPIKPVSKWDNPDDAYVSIAKGLSGLIAQQPVRTTYAQPEWTYWYLELYGLADNRSDADIRSIAAQLRKAANSEKLEYVELPLDGTELKFRSTQYVFESLKSLHAAGKLDPEVDFTIKGLRADLNVGAVLRIASQIVDNEYQSTIRYLPQIFGGRSLEESFPPLVTGIVIPLNNPMQIGFTIGTDPKAGEPTERELAELKARLGRYLNTCLVLTGEQLNVNLTPVEDSCGLPKLLRYTELGRDMLAQDVVLKHYVALQLHPSMAHGKAFWDKVDATAPELDVLEACFRVWIVPDGATIQESTVNGQGHVTIKKLGLKVMCESDYITLQRFRGQCGSDSAVLGNTEQDEQIIKFFKELIVPKIQEEVSFGSRFGLLRQILSVLIFGKWVINSSLGEALKRAGFIGSDTPGKFGLNTVNGDVIDAMKQVYLQLFGDGIWQYTRTRINLKNKQTEKRLYLAGGIELNWDKHNQANSADAKNRAAD